MPVRQGSIHPPFSLDNDQILMSCSGEKERGGGRLKLSIDCYILIEEEDDDDGTYDANLHSGC